jgi:hypothetical protein
LFFPTNVLSFLLKNAQCAEGRWGRTLRNSVFLPRAKSAQRTTTTNANK